MHSDLKGLVFTQNSGFDGQSKFVHKLDKRVGNSKINTNFNDKSDANFFVSHIGPSSF